MSIECPYRFLLIWKALYHNRIKKARVVYTILYALHKIFILYLFYEIVKVFIHLKPWRIFPPADGSLHGPRFFYKDELRPLSLLTDDPTRKKRRVTFCTNFTMR